MTAWNDDERQRLRKLVESEPPKDVVVRLVAHGGQLVQSMYERDDAAIIDQFVDDWIVRRRKLATTISPQDHTTMTQDADAYKRSAAGSTYFMNRPEVSDDVMAAVLKVQASEPFLLPHAMAVAALVGLARALYAKKILDDPLELMNIGRTWNAAVADMKKHKGNHGMNCACSDATAEQCGPLVRALNADKSQ